MAYLKDVTGDWLAWSHAEQQGWSRRLTSPVIAFRNSWNNAFGSGYLSPFGRSGGRAPTGGAPAGGGKPGFGQHSGSSAMMIGISWLFLTGGWAG